MATFPARELPLTISTSAAACLLDAGTDWDLVVRFLHYRSDYANLLNAGERKHLLTLADGFGDISRPIAGMSEQNRMDMLHDWSHVRDSSEAAVARMATAIRSWVDSHTADC